MTGQRSPQDLYNARKAVRVVALASIRGIICCCCCCWALPADFINLGKFVLAQADDDLKHGHEKPAW